MRLDVCFFARPTKEERFRPRVRRKGLQLCNFTGREISAGDVLTCKLRPDLFYINSELASAGKRIDREVAGMGEVKLQSRIGCVCVECRFSVIPIAEFEIRGRKHQVGTQQFSKNPSRRNEAIPIRRENKTVRARHLIRRKRGLEPGQQRRIAIQ